MIPNKIKYPSISGNMAMINPTTRGNSNQDNDKKKWIKQIKQYCPDWTQTQTDKLIDMNDDDVAHLPLKDFLSRVNEAKLNAEQMSKMRLLRKRLKNRMSAKEHSNKQHRQVSNVEQGFKTLVAQNDHLQEEHTRALTMLQLTTEKKEHYMARCKEWKFYLGKIHDDITVLRQRAERMEKLLDES
eukprot:m.41071 g.41071  ORF g.41071 m.41071 type:complete len:185 (-) comp9735_c0_seq2:267-821(-)